MSVGDVIGKSFSIWGRNLLPFAVLSLVAHAPWIAYRTLVATGKADAVPGDWDWLVTYSVEACAGILASGLVVFGVLQQLRGAPSGLGLVVSRGLGLLPRALGAGVLATLCVLAPFLLASRLMFTTHIGALGVGLLGLLIGSLVLLCVTWVTVPAAVAERLSPVGALKRSYRLTLGSKWGVFLVILVLTLAKVALLTVVLMAFGSETGAGLFDDSGDAGDASTPLVELVTLALATLVTVPIEATAAAVGYHDLRTMKDGTSTEDIAKVFD